MITAGEIIYKCRKEMGWSRPFLSAKSNISVSTIRAAEKNGDCKANTFIQLLNAMKYDIKIERRKLV